jgi:hypothetical protein
MLKLLVSLAGGHSFVSIRVHPGPLCGCFSAITDADPFPANLQLRSPNAHFRRMRSRVARITKISQAGFSTP